MTYKKTFGGCNLAGALQNLAKCFLAPVISASIQRQPFRDKDSFEMWQLCATRWGLGNLNNAIVRSLGRVSIFLRYTPFTWALCWQLSKVWHLADERSLVTNAAHDAKDQGWNLRFTTKDSQLNSPKVSSRFGKGQVCLCWVRKPVKWPQNCGRPSRNWLWRCARNWLSRCASSRTSSKWTAFVLYRAFHHFLLQVKRWKKKVLNVFRERIGTRNYGLRKFVSSNLCLYRTSPLTMRLFGPPDHLKPPRQDSLGAAADARDARDAGDAQIWSLDSKHPQFTKRSRMFSSRLQVIISSF